MATLLDVNHAPAPCPPRSARPAAAQRPAAKAPQRSAFLRELHGILAALAHR